jgi:probable O-glycosylation ligase (exosortase A-associated)
MAMLMMLPFFIYLYRYSKERIARIGFAVFGALVLLGVMASASRGAVIGLAVLTMMVIMQGRRKLLGLLAVAAVGTAVVTFAPTQWLDRMDTIQRADEDSSFMGRVASWKMHIIVALNRPLTGGGFSSLEDPLVYRRFVGEFGSLDFIPSTPPVGVLAAHSIYFEVLGDTGVIGLFLFLGVLMAWFVNLRQIKRTTRGRPSLVWAYDLASAFERSLVVYGVSGAALSAAYFENVYIEATLAGMVAACVKGAISARPEVAGTGVVAQGAWAR